MTELQQQKTSGLAIASLVCGLFFMVPLLGFVCGIAAVITGIIALNTISRESAVYKGKGFAITGIVLGGISVVILPIIAILAAIAIPNLLMARRSANDALADSTVRQINSAVETYATANNGVYPVTEADLVEAVPPYLRDYYDNEEIQGYTYSVQFSEGTYQISAEPVECGTSGKSIITAGPQGVTKTDCSGDDDGGAADE